MNSRISVSPQIHFGKPCVSGTRIPVQSVLELVHDGIPFSEIVEGYYPDLEPEDIRALRTVRHRRCAPIVKLA